MASCSLVLRLPLILPFFPFLRFASLLSLSLSPSAVLNLIVILFVIILGALHVDSANWTSPNLGLESNPQTYFPMGANGVLSGAAVVFFSYSQTTHKQTPKKTNGEDAAARPNVCVVVSVCLSVWLAGWLLTCCCFFFFFFRFDFFLFVCVFCYCHWHVSFHSRFRCRDNSE